MQTGSSFHFGENRAAEQGREREVTQLEQDVHDTDLDGSDLSVLAETWSLERLGDLLDATMVLVPAGPFRMGPSKRPCQVEAFSIDRYPVTNAQYARFVRETGRNAPAHWENGAISEGKVLHPVVRVSWHDADAYARWAGKRLPLEKEWEKAARGTDGRAFPWGNDFDAARCNTKETGGRGTTPVNRTSPAGDSPYGCADMVGNVWEWCADWYRILKDVRSLRGGAYWNGKYGTRCDSRAFDNPLNSDPGYGFRCAR